MSDPDGTDHTGAPSQAGRFRQAAEAAVGDPDEAAFRAKLATIARQRPAPDPHPPQVAATRKPARKPKPDA